jgi:hypothetical protein
VKASIVVRSGSPVTQVWRALSLPRKIEALVRGYGGTDRAAGERRRKPQVQVLLPPSQAGVPVIITSRPKARTSKEKQRETGAGLPLLNPVETRD